MIEFKAQTIRLIDQRSKDIAVAKLQNAPVGEDLEMVLRLTPKQRGLDANAHLWAGPVRDIAEQAFIGGRLYSAETWFEQFKREYLPEDDDPELDTLVKNPETYHKWDYTPKGDRILIGSSTQLTKRGFAIFTEQIVAFGSDMGVKFSVSPNQIA